MCTRVCASHGQVQNFSGLVMTLNESGLKTMWLVISWEFRSLNPFVSLELTTGGLGVSHVECVHTHVPGEVARGAVGDFGQNMAVAIFGHAEAAQTAAFEFSACLCHVGRVRQHSSAVS